jgi:hypothetical protein
MGFTGEEAKQGGSVVFVGDELAVWFIPGTETGRGEAGKDCRIIVIQRNTDRSVFVKEIDYIHNFRKLQKIR